MSPSFVASRERAFRVQHLQVHVGRYAHGQSWESNDPRVRFYAGASNNGSTTYFRVAFTVRCQGGHSYANSGSVHDYPSRYWNFIVHIPSLLFRADARFRLPVRAISPSSTNMTIGVDVP